MNLKLTVTLLAFSIVFWNAENFFDWRSGNHPQGRFWTKSRFYNKCNAIAKTLLLMSDGQGCPPDVVALCEVENEFVVRQLAYSSPLRKYGYRYVHYDSPDRRGIDCALLYRSAELELLTSASCHIYDTAGAIIPTRDILLAEFVTRSGDTLAVLANHHPSKRGGGAGDRRALALARLSQICDSLRAAHPSLADGRYVIAALGDFNDTPSAGSRAEMAPMFELVPQRAGSPTLEPQRAGVPALEDQVGSLKYNGAWELIDRCFVSDTAGARMGVFDSPHLTTRDKSFGGTKPLRTFVGPRYTGGVSDHYPIFIIFANCKQI